MLVLCFAVPQGSMAQKKKEKKAMEAAAKQGRGQKVEREECEELAMDITATTPREYGSATSSNEAMATNLALLDARSKMAQQLEVMVKGGASNYMGQAGANGKEVFKNTQKLEQEGYFDMFLRNTRPIKKNTYIKEDGTYNVYVCIEMTAGWDQALFNKLREDEIMSIEVDEAIYRDRLKEAREEFMQRRALE